MGQHEPSFKLMDLRPTKLTKSTRDFKILSMKNTTMYEAGQFISVEQINELIDVCKFNVDIVAMPKGKLI